MRHAWPVEPWAGPAGAADHPACYSAIPKGPVASVHHHPRIPPCRRRHALPGVWAAVLTLSTAVVAEPPAMPIVIAHRGSSGYLPEHTLAAKTLAVAQGADFVEQDVVMTKDGVLVVLHDTTLDGVSDVAARFPGRARGDGRHHVTDFTISELRSLSLSERIDPATGRQTFPDRFPTGASRFGIVTLEEELDLLAGLARTTGRSIGIYPEIKSPAWHRAEGHDVSAAVVALLHRRGYRHRDDPCVIQCFDADEVKRLRQDLGWAGRLVQLVESPEQDDLLTPAGLARVAAVADGIGPSVGRVVDADGRPTDLVGRAHAAGLVVHCWTLRRDRLPDWAPSFDALQDRVLATGVDGVFSDFPDLSIARIRGRDAAAGR